jgi:hypothetical protein
MIMRILFSCLSWTFKFVVYTFNKIMISKYMLSGSMEGLSVEKNIDMGFVKVFFFFHFYITQT